MASERQRIRDARKLAAQQPTPSPEPVATTPEPAPELEPAPEPEPRVLFTVTDSDLQPVTDHPDPTQPPPLKPNDRPTTPL